MRKLCFGLGCAVAMFAAASVQAAYLLEIDTDGLDDGVLTYHPNFGFGGDTTIASQSSTSPAIGMTGGDSIFGGDATLGPDTYVATYTPAVDGDNIDLSGQALNTEGDLGGALIAGGSGEYAIYTTWPVTSSVSGNPITYTLSGGGGVLFSVQIDQNTAQDDDGDLHAGGEWIYLGTATLDANTAYSLTQESSANTFVSMRAAGYLFDAVPEPATLSLLGLGGLAMLGRKRA